MDTKLILLEGLAGSGKSSMGQKLYRVLSKNGYRADFVHEFDSSHPASKENFADAAPWMERVRHNWKRLAAAADGEDRIAILDAAFMQYPVGELLERDLPPQRICDFVLESQEIIRVTKPVLIYFVEHDLENALKKVYSEREKTWRRKAETFLAGTPYGQERKLTGFDLYVEFNRDLRNICDTIYNNCSMKKLRLENFFGASIKNFRKICDCLGVPFSEEGMPSDEYTGSFEEAGSGRQITITRGMDMLEVHGLFPIMKNLLPKEGDVFFVYGKPYELIFIRNIPGKIDGFHMTGFRDQAKNKYWRKMGFNQ